ncbi:D-2-hydroxyacid dehydrogenase [Aureliella helgolandensis]|uniref:2-hydroxyacid dehydrogenase n=1 Tax=Aureliella helgolandensis TaxID=2527968 RepID=A0A518G046_9BACT|nr:D-2-hydroxyacid dehydrogenase [Aureliella helgolandensis]QDV21975.1 Putative 2-hydroxyacid dehydrogenase [Aureliella helgolandensis]
MSSTTSSSSPPNVVLCYPVEARHLALFASELPHANVIDAGQEGIGSAIFDADVFVGHAKVPVDWDAVVAQGRLKLIQSSAAGLDHCLVPSVIESDIPVCSASGLFANQVGEQTLALLLGLLRGMPTFFRQTLAKEFIRRPTEDLHGKRVGIVGMGGNGRRLAQLLAPFQVTIRATDYYPVRQPQEVSELWEAERLEELASVSDILILALPLNRSTRQLISARIFAAMPKGSYLVNVARGQVVDESALIDALVSGHLAAAGLDVTYEEPLPASSPLWELPNVMITPHVGAQSARRVDDSTRFAVDNLQRFFTNQPLLNRVDKTLGFPHPDVMVVNNPQ